MVVAYITKKVKRPSPESVFGVSISPVCVFYSELNKDGKPAPSVDIKGLFKVMQANVFIFILLRLR